MPRRQLPGLEQARRGKTRPVTDCTDLVHVDTSRCPTCGAAITLTGWSQPALFYFGGHGATIMRVLRRCSRCGWALPLEERALNPRHAYQAKERP